MQKKVNIIIPSITINFELLECLKKINQLLYKNFFVTIVLNYDSEVKLPKYKYKVKKLVLGSVNMSKKRNIAAKKFKSYFIAFIDSDAYPNKNWLKYATSYLMSKKGDVVGGPGIPFPKQTFLEKICYYSKRSYFVTGYLNFRKYKAKQRYCDWLEACNLIMEREFFLKYGGMDDQRYTGEDSEFFERMQKKRSNLKVFYSPKLYIHHKERRIFGFFLQRLIFGMDFLNLVKFNSGIKGYQPFFPILIILSFFTILLSNIDLTIKFYSLLPIIILINLAIIIDIFRYVNSLKSVFLTLITINIANISFALGGVITLIGLRKFIDSKIYIYSRNKEK
tara:strand:- start:941 stop:1948 length:1008 start_codon:yes stop_codon:yes gene_type:complete